jgi:hypothetical protein
MKTRNKIHFNDHLLLKTLRLNYSRMILTVLKLSQEMKLWTALSYVAVHLQQTLGSPQPHGLKQLIHLNKNVEAILMEALHLPKKIKLK